MWRIRHARRICLRLKSARPYTDVVPQLYAREKAIAWSRDQNIAIRCKKVDFLKFWSLFLVSPHSSHPLTCWIDSTKVQATLHRLSAVCSCAYRVVVSPKCYLTSWLWITTIQHLYFRYFFTPCAKNDPTKQPVNLRRPLREFYLPVSSVVSEKSCSQGQFKFATKWNFV